MDISWIVKGIVICLVMATMKFIWKYIKRLPPVLRYFVLGVLLLSGGLIGYKYLPQGGHPTLNQTSTHFQAVNLQSDFKMIETDGRVINDSNTGSYELDGLDGQTVIYCNIEDGNRNRFIECDIHILRLDDNQQYATIAAGLRGSLTSSEIKTKSGGLIEKPNDVLGFNGAILKSGEFKLNHKLTPTLYKSKSGIQVKAGCTYHLTMAIIDEMIFGRLTDKSTGKIEELFSELTYLRVAEKQPKDGNIFYIYAWHTDAKIDNILIGYYSKRSTEYKFPNNPINPPKDSNNPKKTSLLFYGKIEDTSNEFSISNACISIRGGSVYKTNSNGEFSGNINIGDFVSVSAPNYLEKKFIFIKVNSNRYQIIKLHRR